MKSKKRREQMEADMKKEKDEFMKSTNAKVDYMHAHDKAEAAVDAKHEKEEVEKEVPEFQRARLGDKQAKEVKAEEPVKPASEPVKVAASV